MRLATNLLVLFLSTTAVAAPKYAPPSKAVSSDVLDAVAEEMNRAMVSLRIPNAPKPYFISYKLTEVDVSDVSASLGSIIAKKERHFVSIEARVRVGSYDFDNSNYVVPDAEHIDGETQITLPLDATPSSARRAAWLVTDAAYKEALLQYRAKVEAGRRPGGVPSHIRGKAVVGAQNKKVRAKESTETLVNIAKRVSGELRKHSHLRHSRVSLTSFIERRWYLNTEGTSASDMRRVSGAVVTATGLAPDGQELSDYVSYYGGSLGDLPSEKVMVNAANEISGRIKSLQAAKPLVQGYSGPVLFEGQAAGALIRYGLSRHLGGTPLPLGMPPSTARNFGGAFHNKLGLRVFPKGVKLVDNPQSNQGGKMIGGFKLDDEGVPAQSVTVIDGGKLTSLLYSRTPLKKNGTSNGHARRTGPGGVYHGSATNLMLTAKRGQSAAALKRALIKLVKDEGQQFGIIIRKLDDSAVTAAPELSRRELLRMVKVADLNGLPPALQAYKVYPSGKEELIRGFRIKEFVPNQWRNLSAVGNKPTTYSFLETGDHYIMHKLRITDEGFVPSSGIESSISTPDLLFPQVELVPDRVILSKPKVPKPGA